MPSKLNSRFVVSGFFGFDRFVKMNASTLACKRNVVRAAQDGQIIVELEAGVVVFGGDEERLAEAVCSAKPMPVSGSKRCPTSKVPFGWLECA